jgi:transposase-like protein
MRQEMWTVDEKLAIVLEGLKGDRSILEICKSHEITPAQYYGWREKFLDSARRSVGMVH